MAENIKALIFVLALGAIVFWMAANRLRGIVPVHEFRRWRTSWFALQTLAFVSPGVWFFYALLAGVVTKLKPKEMTGSLVLFVFLLSTLPFLGIQIPGFGLINHLFQLNFPRALSILILFPIFIQLIFSANTSETRLKSGVDKLVVFFLVVITILEGTQSTFTDTLRTGFINFIDYFLPYFVVSRAIKTKEDFDRLLMAMLLAVSISAVIGLFETIKNWHLYNHLVQHLLGWKRLTNADVRGEILRASATFMTPIVLGYVITIAAGAFFYFRDVISSNLLKAIVFIGLIAALFSTVSRGPWVGFVILLIAFIWTGKDRFSNLGKLGFAGLVSLPVIIASPYGQKFISLLPFIGNVRTDTVDYRQQLIEVSWVVFKQNPLFGDVNFRDNPIMEVMRQGEGIIDVVNSYIGVGLAYGLIGFIPFTLIFYLSITKTYKVSKHMRHDKRIHLLGRSLTAILIAISFIIFTVSSVNYVPWYYWILIGLSSAYQRAYAPVSKQEHIKS